MLLLVNQNNYRITLIFSSKVMLWTPTKLRRLIKTFWSWAWRKTKTSSTQIFASPAALETMAPSKTSTTPNMSIPKYQAQMIQLEA